MAADANLIKGAAAAYGAGTAAKQAGGNQLGAMAQNLLGRVDNRTADLKKRTEEAKERGRILDAEADKRMEDSSLKANALGEEEYRLNAKKVNGWKKQLNRCALGDEACKREIMSKMSMQSQNLQAEKEARGDNQKLYKTLSLGVNPVDKYAMSVYSDPQRGDYTITEDTQGVKSYKIKFPEGMELPIDPKTNKPKDTYTEDEINKLFNKQADLTSTKMTKDMAVDQIKAGNEGEVFDETKIKGSYEDAIGDDLMSAINDDWGVGSFRKNAEDLVRAELEASPIDIDGDGADDDIKAVMSALTDPSDPNYALMPDEERKKYVVNYFVDAQKQQHEKGKQQAQEASLAAQNKTIEKYKFKNFETQLKMAIDNNASANDINELVAKYQLEAGKKTTETSEQVIPVGKTQVVENVNYKEGKDDPNTASMEVSTDRLKGIKKELDDPNTRGLVGYQGYYYKDGENNYRKFKNKQDFIKKQKIKIKDGESEDQAIARFNAKKNKGLVGGKATSYETIYSDEQLSGAEDTKVQKTSTSKTTNSAIGTDKNGNPILVQPKVATADDII